jgi:hypothetical protein
MVRLVGASAAALVGVLGVQTAEAVPIYNKTGIIDPAKIITFDEQEFEAGSVLTYQYSADGVRFSPNLVYGLPTDQFPPIEGNLLRNFFPGPPPYDVFEGLEPFSIKFDDVQQRAAVAINATPGLFTATALRNGLVVDSFTVDQQDPFPTNYFGFEGVEFDEIQFDPPGATGTVLLDNIQLGTRPPTLRNLTGLENPTSVITLDEHVFPAGTLLVDQYADLGVIFSPNLVYGLPSDQFALIDGNLLRNFFPGFPIDFNIFEGLEPFSLLFDTPQEAVAFALNATPGKATITALLEGSVVREYSVEVTELDPSFFYGFDGILFDEIRFDAPGTNGTILLDNIQFRAAAVAVPEPATLTMLVVGLIGLGLMRRRHAA